jgi:hypothetical protein
LYLSDCEEIGPEFNFSDYEYFFFLITKSLRFPAKISYF